MNLFKDALADALTALRLNANQAAQRFNLARGQLSKFLAGPDLPKSETLVSMCDALPRDHAHRLIKAWIYGRIGPAYAASVIAAASDADHESTLRKLLDSLPAETASAFVTLITTARDDEDFRASMLRLAAFLQPAANESTFTGVQGTNQDEKEECARTAPSPAISPTPINPPATARIVTLPPPPVVASLLHSTLINEAPDSSLATEQRKEVIYTPKRKKK